MFWLRVRKRIVPASAPAGVLLGPAFLVLALVAIAPFLLIVSVSFTELQASEGAWHAQWVGLDNFRRLSQDSELAGAAVRTVSFALLSVALELALGIFLGELLHRFRSKATLSLTGLLLPLALAPVVVGLIWRLLYQGEFGILSLLLKSIGLFRSTSITSNPSTAMGALVVVDVWQWTPLVALVYFGIRKSLEGGPVEAARLDGASELTLTRDVVLPAAASALSACALLRFVDAVREFDKVFVLTGGGPGSATELVSLYIWRTAFRNWSFSYAATLGVAFYLCCFMLSWISLRLAKRGIRDLQLSRGE